jgi:hypothetical protein
MKVPTKSKSKQTPVIDSMPHSIVGRGTIVVFDRRPIDKHELCGFVVSASDQWVLLHLLNDDTVTLNGYTAIRIEDIKRYRVTEVDEVRNQALSIRRVRPKPQPLVKVDTIRTLLTTIDHSFPLLTIHTERIERAGCHVGKLETVTTRSLRLQEITPEAEWDEVEKYPLSEITKIDFGGGYETALYEVSKLKQL